MSESSLDDGLPCAMLARVLLEKCSCWWQVLVLLSEHDWCKEVLREHVSGARSVPALGTPPFTPRCGTPGRGLVTALAVYSSSLCSSVLSKMRAIQAHTSSPDNAICFDMHGMTGWYKAFPLLQSCQFSFATCDYFYGVYFNIHVMHPKCLEIACMPLCRRHFQAVAPKPPVSGHLWSWCAPTSARRFA